MDIPQDDLSSELNPFFQKFYKQAIPIEGELQTTLTEGYTPISYRKTYKQNWPIYAKAAANEKIAAFRLIKDAMDHLDLTTVYEGNGRPPTGYIDIAKAVCIKAYSNLSSWRLESELKLARAMGIIDTVPKRSTINKYMQSKNLTKILNMLYMTLAEPLAEIEEYFAADAIGISNLFGSVPWSQIRKQQQENKPEWITNLGKRNKYNKLHIVTGTKTNVICAAKITGGHAADSPFLKPLLDETVRLFTLKEVAADAGYLSKENVKTINNKGAIPFIMGKKNVYATETDKVNPWTAMLRIWRGNTLLFRKHYHRRSNVESTFSMLKRKFGPCCRYKLPVTQENEILTKVVCHNAVVLAEALLSYNLQGGFMASL